jgi:hypothetical protein
MNTGGERSVVTFQADGDRWNETVWLAQAFPPQWDEEKFNECNQSIQPNAAASEMRNSPLERKVNDKAEKEPKSLAGPEPSKCFNGKSEYDSSNKKEPESAV